MKKILSVPLVLFLLLIISAAFNRFLFDQNRSLKAQVADLKKDPQERAKDEAKSLAGKLSSLVSLPEGEDPVIATVTDKDKLKDQPIFEKAENGDKLLIFANAKKAYLFDPKNNKLKDIIPVNMGEVAGATASAPPTAKPAVKTTVAPTATPTPAL